METVKSLGINLKEVTAIYKIANSIAFERKNDIRLRSCYNTIGRWGQQIDPVEEIEKDLAEYIRQWEEVR